MTHCVLCPFEQHGLSEEWENIASHCRGLDYSSFQGGSGDGISP